MSKDGSPPQLETAKHPSIQDIIQKLNHLFISLSNAKDKAFKDTSEGVPAGDKKDVDYSTTDTKGGSKKNGELDMHTSLEKACRELNYMIGAFEKLQTFETDISVPLNTLEANVRDILMDLDRQVALTDHVKQLIESNLKVLRSNITKVKIQIPLQHQVSGTIPEARRYLQTTVSSKEIGHLPSPYEADGIFESGSFLKQFRDHYENLDDRHKLCLLCFAIFPENAEVMKRLLKFWWIGERLRPNPGSDPKRKEDPGSDPKRKEDPGSDPKMKEDPGSDPKKKEDPVSDPKKKEDPVSDPKKPKKKEDRGSDPKEKDFVNETLGQFVDMGFIEPVPEKGRLQATSYKMHPIIRAFIIRLAKEANFFDYDDKGNPTMDISKSKKSCLVKSEGTAPWFSKNYTQQQAQSTDTQQKTKKQEQKDEEQRTKEEKLRVKNLEELQTLFNVSKQFPDLPVELFSKMRNIGVLYLGKWERTAERHVEVEKTEFLAGLKNMNKLRFFSLQGISGILKLPKSVSKLTNLKVLDLRACHNLEELPKGIASLKKLAYLDLSECYLLDNIPKQLSSLTELKVLKGFVISKNSSCNLTTLAALKKLEKLSINVNDDDFSINEAEGDFVKLKALQKLKIAWGAGLKGAGKSSNGKKGSKGKKKQESDAAKSGPKMALPKLKIPWGACGEGSSKSVTGNKVTAAAAKPGLVDKIRDDDRDAKKQGSDTAKPVAKSLDDNGDEKSGMKLVKLDLQCFPEREPPTWLNPENLERLKRLYIRGGELSNLGKSSMDDKKKWKVKYLRLKYLTDIKTSWKELQMQFPDLKYLEKVNCPQITFCPCDASGVWMFTPT